MSSNGPPRAARKYMSEFGESEPDFVQWFGLQVRSYGKIEDPGIDLEGHIAFKMGCTRIGARSVLAWFRKLPTAQE